MAKESEWDYPFIDDMGTTWLDPAGFKAAKEGSCFMCRRKTYRVDINLAVFFCNAPECNARVEAELVRNGYEGEFDEDIARWHDEGGRD